jgi:O-antigen/teichoic acid export membrane protein
MSTVRRNIFANYVGSIWNAIMSLAFVPLYIRFIGIEAYGLVGVYTTILGLLVLLDMGLGATIQRELARMSAIPGAASKMRSLVRTFEIIYCGVGLLIGIGVFLASSIIAHRWLQAGKLAPGAVENAIVLMGAIIALRWPSGVHLGGLMGLQQQVSASIISSASATVRGLGAILVLWKISPSVQAFFIWQMLTTLLQTICTALWLWRCLPPSPDRAHFQGALLKEVWRFAAGMTAHTTVVVALTQTDKIILSRLLSLETFGYYTLAATVTSSLYRLTDPIANAIYPRFTQLVATHDIDILAGLYHRSGQLLAACVLPAVIVLFFFAPEILVLWTRSSVMADETAPILKVMVIGAGLSCLLNTPYILQLAYGWIRFTLTVYGTAALLSVPLLYCLTKVGGARGAAFVSSITNLGFIFIAIPIMHLRLLPGEYLHWFKRDMSLPILGVLTVVAISRMAIHATTPNVLTVLSLLFVLLLSIGVAVLLSPELRPMFLHYVRRWRREHTSG